VKKLGAGEDPIDHICVWVKIATKLPNHDSMRAIGTDHISNLF